LWAASAMTRWGLKRKAHHLIERDRRKTTTKEVFHV
jgi:hypothetical protein